MSDHVAGVGNHRERWREADREALKLSLGGGPSSDILNFLYLLKICFLKKMEISGYEMMRPSFS